MIDPKTTAEHIASLIAEFLGVEGETVTADTHIIGDLGADSLDIVELVIAMEEDFGIEIDDADAEEIQTVGDAVRLIERLTQPAAS